MIKNVIYTQSNRAAIQKEWVYLQVYMKLLYINDVDRKF